MSRMEERIKKKLAYAAHSEKKHSTYMKWSIEENSTKNNPKSVTNSTPPRQKRKLLHLFQFYLLSIWAAHIYA